jgi:hypothetical protein
VAGVASLARRHGRVTVIDPLLPVELSNDGRFDNPLIGRVVAIDLPNAEALSYRGVAHGLMPAGPN